MQCCRRREGLCGRRYRPGPEAVLHDPQLRQPDPLNLTGEAGEFFRLTVTVEHHPQTCHAGIVSTESVVGGSAAASARKAEKRACLLGRGHGPAAGGDHPDGAAHDVDVGWSGGIVFEPDPQVAATGQAELGHRRIQ